MGQNISYYKLCITCSNKYQDIKPLAPFCFERLIVTGRFISYWKKWRHIWIMDIYSMQ